MHVSITSMHVRECADAAQPPPHVLHNTLGTLSMSVHTHVHCRTSVPLLETLKILVAGEVLYWGVAVRGGGFCMGSGEGCGIWSEH